MRSLEGSAQCERTIVQAQAREAETERIDPFACGSLSFSALAAACESRTHLRPGFVQRMAHESDANPAVLFLTAYWAVRIPVVDRCLVLFRGAVDRSVNANAARFNFVCAFVRGTVLESLPPIQVPGSYTFAVADIGGRGDGQLFIFHLLYPPARTSFICDGSVAGIFCLAGPRLAKRICLRQLGCVRQLLAA